jgi:serpin B
MRYLLFAVSLLIVSCNSKIDKTNSPNSSRKSLPQQLKPTEAEVSPLPINQFAFKLLHQQKLQDFLYSPVSLYYPLLLVAQGAKEQTRQELQQLLLKDGTEFSSALLQQAEQQLKSYKELKKIIINNSLWLAQQFKLESEFAQISKDNFLTPFFRVDFSKDSARQQINSYVAQETNNRIKELLPSGSVDALTRAVIINTIFFLEQWKKPFKKQQTRSQLFFAPNENKKIPFMQQEITAKLYTDHQVTFIDLPYSNDRFSFLALMPKQPKKFIQNFSLSYFNQLRHMVSPKKIILQLPKFTQKYYYSS